MHFLNTPVQRPLMLPSSVRANEKYSIKSPFEITNQILGPYTFSATSRHTLNDKIEMYFHDHSFVPLFIQVSNGLRLRSTSINPPFDRKTT
jgi:hypothetical protein